MNEHLKHDVTVLYVEDDEATREEVGHILTRRFQRVMTAENGQRGIQLFRDHSPDLVISDIRMPIMDGLEMMRQIRAIDREVQSIVTTAHNDISYLLQAIDIGIDQYVLKPIETEKFLTALTRCLSIIHLKRETQRHHQEREQLLAQLQESLNKVKQLSGLLPICASCKKIRNDKGYWEQIEAFIRDHSEAVFSHGICPDCARELYPDINPEADKPVSPYPTGGKP